MKKSAEEPLALDVRGLTAHFGSSPVLWDINLEVPRGHLVGIMGPNGAGKTTFIKAILGLHEGTTGVIRLLHHHLNAVRKKIAYVPQKEVVDWDFPMTVYDLVEMGCYPKRGLFRSIRQEDKENVEKAIDQVGLLPYSSRQIGQLSGGQRQRAFLARAIVQEADLYFLDEPFSGIDQTSEQIIVLLLQKMRLEQKTIFVVHHDFISAGKYFDWVVLLNTRLVASGPFEAVFTPQNLRHTYGKDLALVEEVLKISSELATGKQANGYSA
jgi:manganese/zinc/iron transport system ATP- binding protein